MLPSVLGMDVAVCERANVHFLSLIHVILIWNEGDMEGSVIKGENGKYSN